MARRMKPINLALQGGGAHGAFTWGVLDRLLACGHFEFKGLTGTSAGAINAAVLADGFVKGEADGARAALKDFWKKVSFWGRASPIQRTLFDVVLGNWSLDHSPGYLFFDVLSRFTSPYDFNPLNLNPLRDLIAETIDFDRVRACECFRLFIAATNVHSGKIRVFENADLSADSLMASACLPHLFQAIEIDGIPYWDGGFMGNPPLFPLFYKTAVPDTLLIQINPIERHETPKTARDIVNRMNEITFNSTLLRELRAIDFVTRLLEKGHLDAKDYMRVRMHRIHGGEAVDTLSASSKMNAEWAFLKHLRDIGRTAAEHWLKHHYDDVGVRESFNLRTEFS